MEELASAGTATVEWGEPDERRSRWWDRILGREPEPAAGSRAAQAGISRAALACLIVGFALAVAAQLLPWARINAGELGIDVRNTIGTDRMSVGQIGTLQVAGYDLAWMFVFGAAAVLLVLPPSARRIGTAAALGLTAGQLLYVLGLAGPIKSGGDLGRVSDANSPAISYGEGLYAAIAALVLVAVAILLANRRPRRARATGAGADGYGEIEDAPVDHGPIDLTVTPVVPSTPGGRLTARD
jgi:hypothetical protein